jgi:hypothetical protein
MLSGYQLDIVGFMNRESCEAICWDCAVKQYGALTIERTRMGLDCGIPDGELDPVIRYTAGEQASENGYHCGCGDEQDEIPRAGDEPEGYEGVVDHGWEREGTWWPSLYHEACARFDCDNCGKDMAA